ncbi:MAG: hydroxyisourate hydrolase [Gammaproteobacteria bacterium]|nr:hydroxyisourate hydrolase [Gammaproteobacteria bacterium]
MATLTTHVLDSLRGTHAAGLGVTLHRIEASGARAEVFRTVTDAGGRLRKTVPFPAAAGPATFELAFQAADYFARAAAGGDTVPAAAAEGGAMGNAAGDAVPVVPGAAAGITEAVVRFVLANARAARHIPVILAPHGCSLWCSSAA